MKLLFDQNLSMQLIQDLKNEYPNSIHVKDIGMDKSSDVDVWNYAKVTGFAIVTKDADFRQLSFFMVIHQK